MGTQSQLRGNRASGAGLNATDAQRKHKSDSQRDQRRKPVFLKVLRGERRGSTSQTFQISYLDVCLFPRSLPPAADPMLSLLALCPIPCSPLRTPPLLPSRFLLSARSLPWSPASERADYNPNPTCKVFIWPTLYFTTLNYCQYFKTADFPYKFDLQFKKGGGVLYSNNWPEPVSFRSAGRLSILTSPLFPQPAHNELEGGALSYPFDHLNYQPGCSRHWNFQDLSVSLFGYHDTITTRLRSSPWGGFSCRVCECI